MGINNDNNISAFEGKTTLIENSPLAKKSSNTFIDSNSKKKQELLINKILSVLISLLLSNSIYQQSYQKLLILKPIEHAI